MISRKALVFVLLVSLIFVLVGPVVIVKGEKPDGLAFYKVHVKGAEEPYKTGWEITDKGNLKTWGTAECNVDSYVVYIGGTPLFYGTLPVPPFIDYYTIEDYSARYVLGEDFDYEGYSTSKWEFALDADGDYSIMLCCKFTLHGKFDFAPYSWKHDIEGTFEFCQHSVSYYDISGALTSLHVNANGHGTGDLKGVVMNSPPTESSLNGEILDVETGFFKLASFEGTVWDWPLPP